MLGCTQQFYVFPQTGRELGELEDILVSTKKILRVRTRSTYMRSVVETLRPYTLNKFRRSREHKYCMGLTADTNFCNLNAHLQSEIAMITVG